MVDRLRDWLNHPKANGYQALHVTLMSKQGRWIEVQIRSDRMDEVAEKGFAAHWKYKEGNEVVWISKQGGWKGEGCGGNCASCHHHDGCEQPKSNQNT